MLHTEREETKTEELEEERARQEEEEPVVEKNGRPEKGAIWATCRNGKKKNNESHTTRSREAHEALHCHKEVIFQFAFAKR